MSSTLIEQSTGYIDGIWRPLGGPPRLVEDPSSEQSIASVRDADEHDVAEAVLAARTALPGWSALSARARADYLIRIAKGISTEAASLAQTITRELGAPIAQSRTVHVKIPALTFRVAAQQVNQIRFEERLGSSLLRREPVGVVGCITPWNFPLHQLAAKVAGALAAGCTVVVKPSELTPLHALEFARLVERTELPRGVVNVIFGGTQTGRALCQAGGVDMISFTGSSEVGAEVISSGAARIRRSALELGGKSACVVLEGAPLELAVESALESCFSNTGQICAGQSRLLVPRSQLAQVEEIALAAAKRYQIGDPFQETTEMGPLVSREQLLRVSGHVERAVASGTRLLLHGQRDFSLPAKGHFFGPTVFSDVHPLAPLAQQEVFGPVLAIIPYEGNEEAIAIANGTRFGLSGAVWASDVESALAVARRLDTGQVLVNGGAYNPLSPFGGRKASGIGREYGSWGIQEFLECKAIDLPLGLTLA